MATYILFPVQGFFCPPMTCTNSSWFPTNLKWDNFNSLFSSVVHFSHSKNLKPEEKRQKDSSAGEVEGQLDGELRLVFWPSSSSTWMSLSEHLGPLRSTSSLGVRRRSCSYLMPKVVKEIQWGSEWESTLHIVKHCISYNSSWIQNTAKWDGKCIRHILCPQPFRWCT